MSEERDIEYLTAENFRLRKALERVRDRASEHHVCAIVNRALRWDRRTPSDQQRFARLLWDLNTIYGRECGVWLFSINQQFDGHSAVDLIEQGRLDEVETVIEQLTTGAYS